MPRILGGTAWPERVAQFPAAGVTGAEVDRWVRSACLMCSNGCGLEIAVADGGRKEPTMATTQITAEPAVPQLVVTSEFAAPRDLLFRAYTDPDLLAQWLGPRGLILTVDHIDPHHGGTWRYTGSDADGNKYFFHGVFHGTPSRDGIVQTVEFDSMPGRVCLETITFTEREGTTLVTQNTVYQLLPGALAVAVLAPGRAPRGHGARRRAGATEVTGPAAAGLSLVECVLGLLLAGRVAPGGDSSAAGSIFELVSRIDGAKMLSLAVVAVSDRLAGRAGALPAWTVYPKRRTGGRTDRIGVRLPAAEPGARLGRVRVTAGAPDLDGWRRAAGMPSPPPAASGC